MLFLFHTFKSNSGIRHFSSPYDPYNHFPLKKVGEALALMAPVYGSRAPACSSKFVCYSLIVCHYFEDFLMKISCNFDSK